MHALLMIMYVHSVQILKKLGSRQIRCLSPQMLRSASSTVRSRSAPVRRTLTFCQTVAINQRLGGLTGDRALIRRLDASAAGRSRDFVTIVVGDAAAVELRQTPTLQTSGSIQAGPCPSGRSFHNKLLSSLFGGRRPN